MQPRNRDEKEKFWRRELALAASYSGSQVKFCRERGLSIHIFQYWRKKIMDRNISSSKALVSATPFIPIQVESVRRREWPDARWVAEFISHLQGPGGGL